MSNNILKNFLFGGVPCQSSGARTWCFHCHDWGQTLEAKIPCIGYSQGEKNLKAFFLSHLVSFELYN